MLLLCCPWHRSPWGHAGSGQVALSGPWHCPWSHRWPLLGHPQLEHLGNSPGERASQPRGCCGIRVCRNSVANPMGLLIPHNLGVLHWALWLLQFMLGSVQGIIGELGAVKQTRVVLQSWGATPKREFCQRFARSGTTCTKCTKWGEGKRRLGRSCQCCWRLWVYLVRDMGKWPQEIFISCNFYISVHPTLCIFGFSHFTFLATPCFLGKKFLIFKGLLWINC